MVIVYKLVAATLMALAHPSGNGDPSKVKPLEMVQGHDTLIDFPMVRMIQNDKDWSDLWVLHKGVPSVSGSTGTIVNAEARSAPKVDFQKNQVLVVFGGHNWSVQAYDYVKTDVRGKEAVIQLAHNMFAPSAPAVDMCPFIMLVLPREKVAISVELDTPNKDGTHYWNPIAKFPVPTEAKKSSDN